MVASFLLHDAPMCESETSVAKESSASGEGCNNGTAATRRHLVCRCVGPNQSVWVALQEVSERFENLCTVGQETVVKVYHAEKTLQLLDILRGSTLFDCSGLLRRGGGTFRRNRVAEKFQGGDRKNTFFQMMARPLAARTEKNFSRWARCVCLSGDPTLESSI